MVVIALDAQGAAAARPWVEKAGGEYRALLDQQNALGKACGVKYVPVGILVDEDGRLARPVGSVNIGDEEFCQQLNEWVETGSIPRAWREMAGDGTLAAPTADEREADARFQLAVVLLARDRRDEALAELRRAVRLDPQNWLIRKQMWALESPDAFYAGEVDYGWQKQQLEKEKESLLGDT